MTTVESHDTPTEEPTTAPYVDADGFEEHDGPTVAALAPIVPHGALVRSAAPVGDVAAAFADYQDLCRVLLTDDDVQRISGKSFRKKSAWRKLAVAFGVSCELRDRSYDRDEAGNIIRAEVLVRAFAPNGRYMDGLGICDRSERKFSKPQHDIPATAMTRATNRACADLFGMGEVSAEELLDDAEPAHRQSTRARDVRGDAVPSGPPVDPDTTQYVLDAVGGLSDDAKAEWKRWRAAANIGWPITFAQAGEVRGKVAALIAADSLASETVDDDEEPF